MMRVGVYLGSSTTDGGGFQHERAVLQCLRDYAADSGHQFIVFSTSFDSEPDEFRAGHLSFVRIPSPPTPPLWRRAVRRVSREIQRRLDLATKPLRLRPWLAMLPQVVTEADIHLMYYPGPYPVCLGLDIPYILTVWDLQHRLQPEFPEVSSNGQWESREKLYTMAIPRAFAIVADSEAGKEDIIQFYRVPEARVKVLPFLPSRSVWASMSNEAPGNTREVLTKYSIPGDYLFYPSQLWPHKNHAGLLRAVYLLRKLHNIVMPVVLVGSDKANLDYIMQLVDELELTGQVFYLGFVPDADLPALYQQAFALVMPTFFGPTNIPVLEAFALECPVITSDIRGVREQVGDAALLVDPRDAADICDRICQLYRDPVLRETLVQRGKQRIAAWTPQDYAEGLLAILADFEPVRRCWAGL